MQLTRIGRGKFTIECDTTERALLLACVETLLEASAEDEISEKLLNLKTGLRREVMLQP